MLKLDRVFILIVDDDEVIRRIIIEHLVSFGFKNFIEARDGAEAIRHVVDQTQRIDLVISDWDMPRADGLTFLRAIRSYKHRTETPFIMITAQQTNERTKIAMAKKHDVDSYIVKPFRGDVLREKVFAVLFAAEEKKKQQAG